MNIVFVCTGNTCRSPMAEGFMKKLFEDRALRGDIISRGLVVSEQSRVSRNSVLAASEFGVDISLHIPKQLCEQDVMAADYVFGVTLSHKLHIVSMYPQYAEKIYALSELSASGDVSDPYGGNLEIYMHSAHQLYDAVQKIFEKIVDTDANKI